jgi:ribosomal protein S13
MHRNVPAHHKPFPELVEPLPNPTPYWIIDTVGKPWLPTNGMTSLIERKLLVPLVEDARNVARHELAHVKWSPPELPKVDFDPRFLMAIEDARLNLGLVKIELPVVLGPHELEQVARLARADLAGRDVLAFVLRAIAGQGTNAERAILAALAEESQAVRDLAYRHVRAVRIALLRARRARKAPVADFRVVLRLARRLARELERELKALGFAPCLPFPLPLAGAGCCLGHGSSTTAGTGNRGKDVASGELRLVTAPLPHPTGNPRGGRRGKGRAKCEGSYPRLLHRWALDKAIFRHTAPRRRGGTVLIDTSGSMSLDAAGVDQILMASPGAARIAIYSGTEKIGELRIVAKDGRRADARDLVPFGRGNIVDEPALEWLARQDGPRVWISDGGVTGIGDTSSAALQKRCQEIVARAGIQRVKTVQEAARLLAQGTSHAGVA